MTILNLLKIASGFLFNIKPETRKLLLMAMAVAFALGLSWYSGTQYELKKQLTIQVELKEAEIAATAEYQSLINSLTAELNQQHRDLQEQQDSDLEQIRNAGSFGEMAGPASTEAIRILSKKWEM